MFCANCGAQLEEGAVFCSNCGQNLSPDAQEEFGEQTQTVFPEETSWQDNVTGDSFQTPKKPKSKIILPAVAAVLVLGVLGFAFKDSVLAAVAPKFFVRNALVNTIEQVTEQTEKSYKNLYGFDIRKEKEVTATVKATLDEFNDQNFNGIGGEISIAKSDKKKMASVSGDFIYDGDTLLSAVATLDNENILIDVPKLFDQGLKMSSKNFGKDWNDSELAEESDVEFKDNLDLSYDKLFKDEELLTKETKKELKTLTKNFIKTANVEMENGNCDVNNKSVNTKKAVITVETDEFADYISDVIEIVTEDENVTKSLDSESEEMFDEAISELTDGLQQLDEYIDDEITVCFDVYKGKVVKVSCDLEVKEADAEIYVEIAFKDSKTLINHVYVLMEVKAEGEKMTIEAESVGNHIAKGNKFSNETTMEISVPGEDKITVESTTSADMNKKIFEAEAAVKADGEKVEVSIEGTCSNKKGFNLTIEEITLKGDPIGEDIKIKGELSITIVADAKFDKINKNDCLDLFKCSEDDIMDWSEDVANNAEKIGEDLMDEVDLFDDLYGYDDYYDDDYYDDDYYYYDDDEY